MDDMEFDELANYNPEIDMNSSCAIDYEKIKFKKMFDKLQYQLGELSIDDDTCERLFKTIDVNNKIEVERFVQQFIIDNILDMFDDLACELLETVITPDSVGYFDIDPEITNKYLTLFNTYIEDNKERMSNMLSQEEVDNEPVSITVEKVRNHVYNRLENFKLSDIEICDLFNRIDVTDEGELIDYTNELYRSIICKFMKEKISCSSKNGFLAYSQLHTSLTEDSTIKYYINFLEKIKVTIEENKIRFRVKNINYSSDLSKLIPISKEEILGIKTGTFYHLPEQSITDLNLLMQNTVSYNYKLVNMKRQQQEKINTLIDTKEAVTFIKLKRENELDIYPDYLDKNWYFYKDDPQLNLFELITVDNFLFKRYEYNELEKSFLENIIQYNLTFKLIIEYSNMDAFKNTILKSLVEKAIKRFKMVEGDEYPFIKVELIFKWDYSLKYYIVLFDKVSQSKELDSYIVNSKI